MKEPRCVLCNKASEELVPISSPLNIHTCDRHWMWSWVISFVVFVGGAGLLFFSFPETGWSKQGKAALIICASPWIIYEFVRSLRTRRKISAARAALREASRCQGGQSIAPSRDIDRM